MLSGLSADSLASLLPQSGTSSSGSPRLTTCTTSDLVLIHDDGA